MGLARAPIELVLVGVPAESRSFTSPGVGPHPTAAGMGARLQAARTICCVRCRIQHLRVAIAMGAALLVVLCTGAWAKDAKHERTPSAARGHRKLLDKAFLPPWFGEEVFENLWTVWPAPLRARAEAADATQRRAMTLARYGLDERPNEGASGPPLQFTPTDSGWWTLNCFACHGGSVNGEVILGLPNNRFAYQTLSDDVLAYKQAHKVAYSPFDLGGRIVPLGRSNGTTNAVVFSITLLRLRDEHLNMRLPRKVSALPHHDLDAPPWWHYRKRTQMYIDGFGKKNARSLMTFTLVPQNRPPKVYGWESDFEDIAAFIRSVRPPKYPFPIDAKKAQAGAKVFERACASCHGTYGDTPSYPQEHVPIDDIGTDRVRFDSLKPEDRAVYANSWLTAYDPTGVVIHPPGYVAPPLDGVWATAPYFHNGSVPTLWHVLHPTKRPPVWRRTEGAIDTERVGLTVEELTVVPPSVTTGAKRRTYFDTRIRGKRADGHDYPAALTEVERAMLLEYLKTL